MRPPYPSDAWPFREGDDSPGEPDFRRISAGTLGLILFLVSLTVLFAASLVAFVTIRHFGPEAPPSGALQLPAALWVSTAALLLAAGAFHVAQRAAHRGATRSLRIAVGAAFALGLAFIAVQTPALIQLLTAHRAAIADGVGLYGLTFMLILLHAAHVVGGMIPLTWLAVKAARNRLWPRHHRSIRATAAYWHFLDIVWLVMLATFLIAG